MTTFLADETTYTIEQLAEVIREQLAIGYDRTAGNLRSAVMYCPLVMTAGEFVQAATLVGGVHPGSARNRYHETRRWQRELGEIE